MLECPQAECDFPQWYGDGNSLAYERLDQTSNSTVPRFSVWSLELTTGRTQPIFNDPAFASYAPAFSPDGRWLSYISTGDNMLTIFRLADGHTQTVPMGFHTPIPEAWSPASDALLFGAEATREEWAPMHMKVYWLSSGRLVDLGDDNDATDYSGAWSPDGQWIAVDRSVPASSGGSDNQVWLMRPDGAEKRLLVPADGASYSSLNWSPDSRYLTYSQYALPTSGSTTAHFDTYMVDVQTAKSDLLLPGADLAVLLP
jgi:Tol biopolymer transport system component